jgi:hypothetical protein
MKFQQLMNVLLPQFLIHLYLELYFEECLLVVEGLLGIVHVGEHEVAYDNIIECELTGVDGSQDLHEREVDAAELLEILVIVLAVLALDHESYPIRVLRYWD